MISATQLLRRARLWQGAAEFQGYVEGPLRIPWSAVSRLVQSCGESTFHADPIDYMNPNLYELSWQQSLVRWWDRGYFNAEHEVMLLPAPNQNVMDLYIFKKALCIKKDPYSKDGTLPLAEDSE